MKERNEGNECRCFYVDTDDGRFRQVATIDSRTPPECGSRDGKVWDEVQPACYPPYRGK